MLYMHVALLRRHGFEAWVLHQQAPFRPAWLDIDVPVSYLDKPAALPEGSDLLVVPDVLAGAEPTRALVGRRIVFVQGPYTILPGLRGACDYRALGFVAAMVVLPSVGEIVERHFGVTASVVPPCVASHFFADPAALDGELRERRILLTVPKVASADSEVLRSLLARQLSSVIGWTSLELRGFSHAEVARLMKSSAFLLNTNAGEAFNTTVPEAMAAGCIALCYEAYGGRDFLRDGENAFVFPNHYVFPLVDRLFELMAGFDTRQGELAAMRRRAYATARTFTEARTEQALLEFMAGHAH
jgi:hypothetical protein